MAMEKCAFVVATPCRGPEPRADNRPAGAQARTGVRLPRPHALVIARVVATDEETRREMRARRGRTATGPETPAHPDDTSAWDLFLKDMAEIQEQMDVADRALVDDLAGTKAGPSASTAAEAEAAAASAFASSSTIPVGAQADAAAEPSANSRELKSAAASSIMSGILRAQNVMERVILRAESDSALLARVGSAAVSAAQQKVVDLSREITLALAASPPVAEAAATAAGSASSKLLELPKALARAAYSAGAVARASVTPTRPRPSAAQTLPKSREWDMAKSFEWQRAAASTAGHLDERNALELMAEWQRERRRNVAYRIVRDAAGVNEAKVANLVLGGSFKLAKSTSQILGRVSSKQMESIKAFQPRTTRQGPSPKDTGVMVPVVDDNGAPIQSAEPRARKTPAFPNAALQFLPLIPLTALGGAASGAGIVAATAMATGSIALTIKESTQSNAMAPDFVYSVPSSYQSEVLKHLANAGPADIDQFYSTMIGGLPLSISTPVDVAQPRTDPLTTKRGDSVFDVDAEEKKKRMPFSRRILYLVDSVLFDIEVIVHRASRRAVAAGLFAHPVEGEWQTLRSLQRKKNEGIYK